jgi:hypothetical protein
MDSSGFHIEVEDLNGICPLPPQVAGVQKSAAQQTRN